MSLSTPNNSDTEKKRILRDRAKELARESEPAASPDESVEVVEFALAFETYAVPIRFVREVLAIKELTPVPCAPPFVAGIVNVRSQILPVIDLKRFFDLPEEGIADLHHIIIFRGETLEVGVLADLVTGVRSLSLANLQCSLPTLAGIRADFIEGVTQDGKVLLDAEKILSDRRLVVEEFAGSGDVGNGGAPPRK